MSFQEKGRALLANGFSIVPIRPGEKRPAISKWQHSRLGIGDLDRFPGCGVGVLCGIGAVPVVGIDVDISHPKIGPAVVAWCEEHLGMAPQRVGDAPRVLLVYQGDGWKKGYSTAFFDSTDPVKASGKRNVQRVEILCIGQQFVAHHVHPDTGRPYEWVDLFGGIEHMRASDLSRVTEAQVNELLTEVDRLVRSTPSIEILSDVTSEVGAPVGDGFGQPPVELAPEECRPFLAWHKADDHDHWVNVGMALHHQSDGAAWGLSMWEDWSRTADNFKPGVCKRRWASFGRSGKNKTTMRWVIKLANEAKRDAEQDEQRAAMAQVRELLKSAKDSVDLAGPVAKSLQKLLPESPVLQAETLGLLQATYKDLTGVALARVDGRAMLGIGGGAKGEQRAPTVLAVRPLTEFGNAERMLDLYARGLMFVPETGTWHIWNGSYWRKAVEVEIEHLAKETVRGLAPEEGADLGEFYRFAAVSQTQRMVKNMVALAASDPRVATPARELDRDLDLLGVHNGVVDLTTGLLRESRQEDRITQTAGAIYNPDARCPWFEQTVLDAFEGRQEMADYFQRLVGYAVSGRPSLSLLVILFGMGANGKSTILNAVRKSLGDYARVADAASFISDGVRTGGGGPREDLVRLRGARLVYVSEPDEGGELREGFVKTMTGGESIVARSAYAKHSVEIEPTWTVIMPTNHKPIVRGSDHGIWRRLELVPFAAKFAGEKADPNRPEKLLGEMPGILAWVVKGSLKFRAQGLQSPSEVVSAKVAYREQMDILAEWLSECCVIEPDAETASSELWTSWENFARVNGCLNYVKSSISLSRRLESRFPGVMDGRGRRFRRGLRLKVSL